MQTIKCRDDTAPLCLAPSPSDYGESRQFVLVEDSTCTWVKEGQAFGSKVLRRRIEPWLTALVQSEHLSLLVGSGLSHAVHQLATAGRLPGMDRVTFESLNDEISLEVGRVASVSGRNDGNIEDQIRVANELIRGLEILSSTSPEGTSKDATLSQLRSNLTDLLRTFADSILEGEHNLVTATPDHRDIGWVKIPYGVNPLSSRDSTCCVVREIGTGKPQVSWRA